MRDRKPVRNEAALHHYPGIRNAESTPSLHPRYDCNAWRTVLRRRAGHLALPRAHGDMKAMASASSRAITRGAVTGSITCRVCPIMTRPAPRPTSAPRPRPRRRDIVARSSDKARTEAGASGPARLDQRTLSGLAFASALSFSIRSEQTSCTTRPSSSTWAPSHSSSSLVTR